MINKILGFLNIEGWDGVKDVYLFIGIGTAIGMTALYYFLVYQKEEMPTKITIPRHLFKIAIWLGIIVFLILI
jgi:hypothetical protein